MTRDRRSDDPRALWQNQPSEEFRMSPLELRTRVAVVQKKLRRQIMAIYAAIAYGVIASIVIITFLSDALIRAGAALFIVASLHMLYLVWYSRTVQAAHVDGAAAEPSLNYYRADLERHMYLITGPQLWTRFFLMLPAAALIFAGIARSVPDLNVWFYYGVMGICGVSVVAAIVAARRKTAVYRREIASLDRLA
jgi:hypothetical protein